MKIESMNSVKVKLLVFFCACFVVICAALWGMQSYNLSATKNFTYESLDGVYQAAVKMALKDRQDGFSKAAMMFMKNDALLEILEGDAAAKERAMMISAGKLLSAEEAYAVIGYALYDKTFQLVAEKSETEHVVFDKNIPSALHSTLKKAEETGLQQFFSHIGNSGIKYCGIAPVYDLDDNVAGYFQMASSSKAWLDDLAATLNRYVALQDAKNGSFCCSTEQTYTKDLTNYTSGKIIKDTILVNQGAEKSYLSGRIPIADYTNNIAAIVWIGEDHTELTKQAQKNLFISLGVFLAALIIGLIGTRFIVSKNVLNPLDKAVAYTEVLARGDLSHDLNINTKDEFGKLAVSLNSAIKNLQEVVGGISQNAETLVGSADDMSLVSQGMSQNAEETSSQAEAVASASEEVNSNVDTAAAAVTEMSATVSEIAQSTASVAGLAEKAASSAKNATAVILRLGDSSTDISNVVNLITSIAEQTNLLALNATIEAARAGEAGKGFAVVANEVKELAKESANATETISKKIEVIQEDSTHSVDAIQELSELLGQISDFSNTIASAVEDQNATTNEISRNITEAASGSGEISANIAKVAEAAKDTTAGANDTLNAASSLASMAGDLRQLVKRFTY